MTSRRAKRRQADKELKEGIGRIATALQKVDNYVTVCEQQGVSEYHARALVPWIRDYAGEEPMTEEEFLNAILDIAQVTCFPHETVAAAFGVGLQMFSPQRVPEELRA